MKKIVMVALIALAFMCNAESYGNKGAATGRIGVSYNHQTYSTKKPVRNYNSAAKQNSISKIEKLEKQIALNEKKIAENVEIERKTKYKGTTSFSTRDKTNQNIKLKKQLIEERAKLRKMK